MEDIRGVLKVVLRVLNVLKGLSDTMDRRVVRP